MTIVGEEKSGNVPLLSRRRRSTDNITNASPDLATANISVVIVTTGCRVYDPNRERWDPNGCTVCNYNAMVYTLFIYFLTSFIVYGNNAVIKFSFFFTLVFSDKSWTSFLWDFMYSYRTMVNIYNIRRLSENI